MLVCVYSFFQNELRRGRDLYERPYGRFFNIPFHLARMGHEVTLVLTDYRLRMRIDGQRNGMHWVSTCPLPNPIKWLHTVERIATNFRPDWIIGMSDTWYGLLAAHLSSRLKCRLAIDAYDNYESYIPWAIPLHKAWRRATSRADLVTAAGEPLLRQMTRNGANGKTLVVPMSADTCFVPMNKIDCRRKLGLPVGRTLIGHTGSLHASRDTDILLDNNATFQRR